MALRRPSSAPATRTPTKAPRSLSAKLLRAHSNSEFDEKRLRRLLKKKLKQHEQQAKSLREAAAAEGREAHMPFQLVADPASPYGMRCSFDGPASAKKHGFDDWMTTQAEASNSMTNCGCFHKNHSHPGRKPNGGYSDLVPLGDHCVVGVNLLHKLWRWSNANSIALAPNALTISTRIVACS